MNKKYTLIRELNDDVLVKFKAHVYSGNSPRSFIGANGIHAPSFDNWLKTNSEMKLINDEYKKYVRSKMRRIE